MWSTQTHNALLGDGELMAAAHGLPGGFTSPALAVIALWATAAAVLPWLIRGRILILDLVGAAVWIAALVAAMHAVGVWTGIELERDPSLALVLAASIGCAISIFVARLKRRSNMAVEMLASEVTQ